MSSPATITVIIPSRNRPHYVRRAVRSVLAQTYSDWRLIVIDDASDTPVSSALLGTDDPRVAIRRLDAPGGVSRARNVGIDESSTPWIAFLDDDDLWAPEKLELQLRAAREAGATMVFSAGIYVTDAGLQVADRDLPPADDLAGQLIGMNIIGEPSTVIVTRDELQRSGGFDPELSTFADWDLWLRLSRTAEIVSLPAFTTAVLVHDHNMQVTDAAKARAEIDHLRGLYGPEAARRGRTFGSAALELWLARNDRRAHPSPRTTFAFLRRLAAVAGLRTTALHVVHMLGARMRRGDPAPAWVLRLLDA
ncbi:MAG: glycosyltransferase family 2 protein [Solirubrobacteraceae bacterium]